MIARAVVLAVVWAGVEVVYVEGQAAGDVASAQDDSRVVARVDAQSITIAELDSRVAYRLATLQAQEYRLRRRILDEMIAGKLLEHEAALRGWSVDELLRVEIEEKARKVTEEEARVVYDSAKRPLAGVSEEEALTAIATGMRQQRLARRRADFLNGLKTKVRIEVHLEPPRVPVDSSDDPSWGPSDASVSIIIFSDFQCPFCAQVAETLRQVKTQYGDRVRLVYRDFPLPNHRDAPKAAEAGACAAEQDKFWPMHDVLFKNQSALSIANLERYAAEAGLDPRAFADCLNSGAHAREWEQDRADGERYGVGGTPAIFINGVPLLGAPPLQALVDFIEEELQRIERANRTSPPK